MLQYIYMHHFKILPLYSSVSLRRRLTETFQGVPKKGEILTVALEWVSQKTRGDQMAKAPACVSDHVWPGHSQPEPGCLQAPMTGQYGCQPLRL